VSNFFQNIQYSVFDNFTIQYISDVNICIGISQNPLYQYCNFTCNFLYVYMRNKLHFRKVFKLYISNTQFYLYVFLANNLGNISKHKHLQSMFTTNVPFKTKCFLGIISLAHTYVKDAYYNFTQVLNIIWEMWSISMDNVNIRCVRSCRENIFPGQIYEVVGGGSLRFQCRGWISLTDFRLTWRL